jgi:hypothetical protein
MDSDAFYALYSRLVGVRDELSDAIGVQLADGIEASCVHRASCCAVPVLFLVSAR